MTTTMKPNQESRQAMADALRWRLTGLLLERPRSGWLEEVEALAAEVDDPLLREAAGAACDATEGIYLDLFAEGGFVSPRETTWRHREDPSHILADIAGFYEAFAFHPEREDPLDHVAVEAGFLGYLCLKQARALFHGDHERLDITATARGRFIDAHLAHFASAFAERVAATGVPHLVTAARALAAQAGKGEAN